MEGFVRADELVEKAITEFEGLYKAYNSDLVSYEEVLDYIDNNTVLKGLFIEYIVEKIRDQFEKFNLSDLVNIKGVFNPYYEQIDEVIDGFMDWLKYRYLHGDINAKTQL